MKHLLLKEFSNVYGVLNGNIKSSTVVAGIDLAPHVGKIIPKAVVIGECPDFGLDRFVGWWESNADGLTKLSDPVNELPYPRGLHEGWIYNDYPGIRFTLEQSYLTYALRFAEYEYLQTARVTAQDDNHLFFSDFVIYRSGLRFP